MGEKVLVLLASGFEDIETVAPIDVLTRAGVEVTVATISSSPVKGAYGTRLIADKTVAEVEELYDGVVIPGGKANAHALASDSRVIHLIQHHFESGKLVAAICASPSHVLGEGAGILRGRRATGDPAFDDKLSRSGAHVTGENVTSDGNIITGMGPGSALEFALKVTEYFVGSEIVDGLRKKWRLQDS